ncbi:UBX domain-containing 2A [Pelobates cultripes]|uniref:UBX domain-containing 2A n=1 Tax=Pelobates cultripes TaxID=61616 RepID=A0AAD1RBX7_PELCU|nr:UBX domain-containing 2A [Pelobates cultripes]
MVQGRTGPTMREADRRDIMKSHERMSRSGGRGIERKRCDSFINSLFEEAEDGGGLNASPEDVESHVDVVIKMWKNGFTINDGQLRDYGDSANRQFMDAMRKGELPTELQRTFEKEELAVNVEDRKTEDYYLWKLQVNPFSGLGHRLGSATPKIITKEFNGLENGDILPSVEVNELEPLTSLKIWLADGKQIVQRFNTSHRQYWTASNVNFTDTLFLKKLRNWKEHSISFHGDCSSFRTLPQCFCHQLLHFF